MATKDFSKMTTKKLNALMGTASEEDQLEIQKVLDTRAQMAGQTEAPAEVETPAETEEAAEKPAKMTAEELHTLATEYKEKYLGHKCRVVPFNTIEWVNGYIAGVIEEKRSMKLLLAIRTEDGKKIVKIHDSKLLEISEEVAERPKASRTRTVKEKSADWTREQIEAAIAELFPNVGRPVIVKEEGEEISGRITGIVTEKRGQTFMYRIEYMAADAEGTDEKKVMHRVYTNEAIELQDMDDFGAAYNEKFMARRENMPAAKTPAEKFESLKADVATALRSYELWAKRIEERKARLDEFIAANPEFATEETPESNKPSGVYLA